MSDHLPSMTPKIPVLFHLVHSFKFYRGVSNSRVFNKYFFGTYHILSTVLRTHNKIALVLKDNDSLKVICARYKHKDKAKPFLPSTDSPLLNPVSRHFF